VESKDFQELVNKMRLSSDERNHVWSLFKTEGIEKALSFLQDIQIKLDSIRQGLALRKTCLPYQIWGGDLIEAGAIAQMDSALKLPVSVAGALMPDAHEGYGLPIGGVLATENAVLPYAVGVDIACRMMLTIYPVPSEILKKTSSSEYHNLCLALLNNTIFGSGASGIHEGKIEHSILEKSRWNLSKITLGLRDTAIHQIGTSGSGNHFVEWGELEIINSNNPFKLSQGKYLALLSHSGSRGVGFKIATHYTELAKSLMPDLDSSVKHLAWLPLDQDLGREYWESMELAGEFASANHHVIHERVSKAAGLTPIASVENHHNFAWREKIIVNGIEQEVIIHRKGATPAQKGTLGVIPGTMADAGYVVVGKGNINSLNSASHGSGRCMSRTNAKKMITPSEQTDYLERLGIQLFGGGLDEAPQAYKSIENVIDAQKDLVDIIGKFQPKIVRMASEENLRRRAKMPKGIIEGE
jgi:tRNA-splicing ligase RtcB